jgi:hypothetical protein
MKKTEYEINEVKTGTVEEMLNKQVKENLWVFD